MNDETILKLGRLCYGTGLLITHAFTGIDSWLIVTALFLLGIPVELLKYAKEKKEI